MPEGSKVEEVYSALRREGKSKESAAKIAQSQTGEALATGKPPKGHENKEGQIGTWKGIQVRVIGQDSDPNARVQIVEVKNPDKDHFVSRNELPFLNAFQNGRAKALVEIQNKMASK